MDKKRLLINCSCEGDEVLKLLSFEQEPFDSKEDREIYVNFIGEHLIKGSDKLKTIWSILRYGEFENYGVLVDKNEIKNIINYLQETLDSWETLDQKPYCRHEMISIETNPFSIYGTKEAYIACKKCGLTISEAQEKCNHEVNCFGVCNLCNKRLDNFNCQHVVWEKEPDTDNEYCSRCGKQRRDDYTDYGKF